MKKNLLLMSFLAYSVAIFFNFDSYAATKIQKKKNPHPESVSKEINQEYQEEISKIESYLNNISTLVTDFTQIAPDGGTSTGTFFLSRPGKLRLQYNPPVPILIVVNGSLLAYYDYELNQVTHSSAKESLASFLTRPNINLSSDVIVKKLERSSKALRVRLAKKDKSEDGELTLIFSEAPFELKKMEIIDTEGMTISVTFNNAKRDIKLDKKLFTVQNLNLRK